VDSLVKMKKRIILVKKLLLQQHSTLPPPPPPHFMLKQANGMSLQKFNPLKACRKLRICALVAHNLGIYRMANILKCSNFFPPIIGNVVP